ncbi:Probable methyltransferase-like protein 24 [Apodemus speciosus]|uniref:D-aspartate oxidase n=1 Tax=Apodemus speciosus TaxID=105296 RepID=A0ABQ0F756_APOSI
MTAAIKKEITKTNKTGDQANRSLENMRWCQSLRWRPGCLFRDSDCLERDLDVRNAMDTVRIAVVGAGVIGLSTAACISQLVPRCSVTVLSDRFSPDTTSNVAAGMLIPHTYPDTPVPTQKRWFRETFQYLSEIAKSAEAADAGVHLVSGIFRSVPEEEAPFWADVVLGFRKMTEAELKRFPQHVFGQAFTTLKCETSAYLPWLEKRIKESGGLLLTRRIEDLWELHPSFDIVVNCSGLGSRRLVGDAMISPSWDEALGYCFSAKCVAMMGMNRASDSIACDHMGTDSLATDSSPAQKPWLVCLDDRFGLGHQIRSKRCRLYSLGLGSDDTRFEVSMANGGCEVHRFDPSIKAAHVLESQRLWHHRLSIDWRDPHPAVAAQKPHSHTRKLGSILNEFGHHKIDVLKADLESAEWKVLENLILEDVLEQIGQLVFEIHLHWPGFEVRGSESGVVRFWYSLLKELERKHFRLFHTYKDLSKPQLFLEKDRFNASSCYTLSWVNTRWR